MSRWLFLRSLFAVWITAALVGTSRAGADHAEGAAGVHFGKSQTHEVLLAVLQLGAKTLGPLRPESARPPDLFFANVAAVLRQGWSRESARPEPSAPVASRATSLVGTVELRI